MPGTVNFQFALRWSRLALDVFLLGTAMVTPPYRDTTAVPEPQKDSLWYPLLRRNTVLCSNRTRIPGKVLCNPRCTCCKQAGSGRGCPGPFGLYPMFRRCSRSIRHPRPAP